MIQETIEITRRSGWRVWLENNCETPKGIWLIFYRKFYRKRRPGEEVLTYFDARDEALCFGWIDSAVRVIDDEKLRQFFSPRRPKSLWSELNIDIANELIKQNLMTSHGLAAIEKARANGLYHPRESAGS